MSKEISGITITRATEKDIDKTTELMGFLDCIFEYGEFPGEEDDHWDTFDAGKYDDLKRLYDKIRRYRNMVPSALARIVWGYSSIMDSGYIDMDSDVLALKIQLTGEEEREK